MLAKCKSPGCYNDATCHGGYCAVHVQRTWPKRSYQSGRSRPISDKPHLGCELECVGPSAAIEKAMRSCGKAAHHDGSLSAGIGCEFKFCRKVEHTIKDVCKFAEMMANVGATVNSSCGLHVHLDARTVSESRRKNFLAWLKTWQDWWFRLVPKKRRNGTFTQKIGGEQTYYSHYTWANMTRYDTIELRLHPGTLNPHKLPAWLTVCWDMMNLLRDESKPLPDVKWVDHGTSSLDVEAEFLASIFRPESVEYLRARRATNGVLSTNSATSRGPMVDEGNSSDDLP
jgi:hypothetical protein